MSSPLVAYLHNLNDFFASVCRSEPSLVPINHPPNHPLHPQWVASLLVECIDRLAVEFSIRQKENPNLKHVIHSSIPRILPSLHLKSKQPLTFLQTHVSQHSHTHTRTRTRTTISTLQYYLLQNNPLVNVISSPLAMKTDKYFRNISEVFFI